MSFDFLGFFAAKSAAMPARVPAVTRASADPSLTTRMMGMASQLGGWVTQKVQGGLNAPSVKKATEMAGNTAQGAKKVAWGALSVLDEWLDVDDDSGVKYPFISIKKSHERLSKHDKPFADFIELLADQAGRQYIEHAGSINALICDSIRGEDRPGKEKSYTEKALSSLADLVDWFLNLSEDLIADTIKANILHIAANLADKGFDPTYSFSDNQRNPLGRLLSVMSESFIYYEDRLQKISELPDDQQKAEYKREFEILTKDLLAKFFPNGAQDIQLFHPSIPCINIVKDQAWAAINQHLPVVLERLYHEMRPIEEKDEKDKGWKAGFNQNFDGLEADQCMHLPSACIHMIKKDKGKRLDDQIPEIEKLLCKQGIDAKKAQVILKYAKELLLTEDASLHKMGAFFERYLMEHLLYSLAFYDNTASEPVLLDLLKRWTKGNVFKLIASAISGTPMTPADKIKAVQEFLTPFGLNQQESFPLPPMIKEGLWKTIDKYEKDKLPDLIFDAIPIWMSLNKKAYYRLKIDDQLADTSLTDTASAILGKIIDEQLLTLKDISLAETLNEINDRALPSLMLSEDQQEQIDEQWQTFVKEKEVLDVLKNFGQQCAEVLTQQLFLDLYKRYQKENEPIEEANYLGIGGMHWLFGDVDLEDEIDVPSTPSFVEWLFLQGTKVCENLALEEFSANEMKALREAIQLRDGLRDPGKDPMQAKKDRAELDKLWVKIEPQFKSLTQQLLKTLGYEKASQLPFPEFAQTWIWKNLNEKAPSIIFEQMGDALLPVFEKKNLQAQVEALPNGALMKRGCHSVSQDVVNHLAEFLTKEDLEELMEKLPELKFTAQAKSYVADTLIAIINQDHPAYEPIWKWIASYVEGLLLKVTLRMNEMEWNDLQKIHTLAENTREEILALEDDEEEIKNTLVEFTDDFLDVLGIQMPQDLFGIPQAVQKTVLKQMKAEIANKLLGVYCVEHKISNHVVRPNPVADIIPTDEVAKAILSLTHYAFDTTTDGLTKRIEGKVKVIPKIYESLDKQLEKQAAKGFQTAELFQEVIKDQLPTPLLTRLFDWLDAPSTQAYKKAFAEGINPLLTDQVIQLLAPVLKKEKEVQAEFDQALLMALVPVFASHLKHLNQASKLVGGLNYDNFIDAAGDEIHAAVPLAKEDEKAATLQAKKNFYSKQMDLIFPIIFPNGKEDLNAFLLDFKLSDKQFNLVADMAKDGLADQLPEMLDSIFDREMLVELFGDLFESVIDEVLDQPINVKSDVEKDPLSEEERARRKEMDQQIGELVIEAVKFMDLPVGFFERLPGWGIAKKSTYEAVGAAVRKQFNGEFLAENLQKQLPKLAEKKHIKKSDEEKVEFKRAAERRYKELERKLAEKSVAYIFNYLGARIKHATDIFTNPILRGIRYAILATCSFIIVRLIGSTLHFLKVDRFIINRLHDFIQHVGHKSLDVFSQKDLHTDAIYQGVEAFEDALTAEMAK